MRVNTVALFSRDKDPYVHAFLPESKYSFIYRSSGVLLEAYKMGEYSHVILVDRAQPLSIAPSTATRSAYNVTI